jgi:hypothetical protein
MLVHSKHKMVSHLGKYNARWVMHICKLAMKHMRGQCAALPHSIPPIYDVQLSPSPMPSPLQELFLGLRHLALLQHHILIANVSPLPFSFSLRSAPLLPCARARLYEHISTMMIA